jgi:hypothetical protein
MGDGVVAVASATRELGEALDGEARDCLLEAAESLEAAKPEVRTNSELVSATWDMGLDRPGHAMVCSKNERPTNAPALHLALQSPDMHQALLSSLTTQLTKLNQAASSGVMEPHLVARAADGCVRSVLGRAGVSAASLVDPQASPCPSPPPSQARPHGLPHPLLHCHTRA